MFLACFLLTNCALLIYILFDNIVVLPVLLKRKCVQVLISYQTIGFNMSGGGGSRNMNYFDTTLFCKCTCYGPFV